METHVTVVDSPGGSALLLGGTGDCPDGRRLTTPVNPPLPKPDTVRVTDPDGIPEPPSRMDVALLQAVVDTGSLREVARTLGLTQSAVDRRLSRFESRVGAQVVIRGDETLRLTEAGWALFSAGHRLLQALSSSLRQAIQDVGGSTPGLPPMLRLAVFGNDWAELADDLAIHVPGMLLRVVNVEPAAGLELFERHSVDALYTWTMGEPEFNLGRPVLAETVVEEPLWVALPGDHRYARHDSVSLAELADDEWIVGCTDEARGLMLAAGQRSGFEPKIAYTVEGDEERRSLLANGWGVALTSPLIVSCRTRAAFVLRELTDAPTRQLVLLSDPTVVSGNLAEALHTRLVTFYTVRAEERNPAYRASAGFPRFTERPPQRRQPDSRLFAGLSVAPLNIEGDGIEPTLEPEDLYLLRVVGDCGSLNRAAPVLLITQPALTRRISRLERRLGLQLLLRGHRGTALTLAARRLLEGAAEAEAFFHSVKMAVRESQPHDQHRRGKELAVRLRRVAPASQWPLSVPLGVSVSR